jgi:hypothetical protein
VADRVRGDEADAERRGADLRPRQKGRRLSPGRLAAFTGISGSGRSSLVFGTIAAESRRLINETYSAFWGSYALAPDPGMRSSHSEPALPVMMTT